MFSGAGSESHGLVIHSRPRGSGAIDYSIPIRQPEPWKIHRGYRASREHVAILLTLGAHDGSPFVNLGRGHARSGHLGTALGRHLCLVIFSSCRSVVVWCGRFGFIGPGRA